MEGISSSLFSAFQSLQAQPLSSGGASPSPIQPQTASSTPGRITISPESRLKNFLSSSARFDVSQATISITTTLKPGSSPADLLPDFEDAGFDMLLRSIARDEKDYQRLKGSFKKAYEMARQAFSSQGHLPAAAGNQAQAQAQGGVYQFTMQLTHVEGEVQVTSSQIQAADPLVMDLKGTGIELTQAGKGSMFDINGDGRKESTAWVKGNTGFLVLDRNQNGTIDSGHELFGDQNGAINGFKELARYDQNSDGVIDSRDSVFKALKVYQDINGNGNVEKSELSSMEKVGIASINLDFTSSSDKNNGNSIILKGSFTTKDGTRRDMADALLGYQ